MKSKRNKNKIKVVKSLLGSIEYEMSSRERRFCVFVHGVNLSTIANGCYLLSDCKHIKEKYFMTQSCPIKSLFCRQKHKKALLIDKNV